jgi:mRNA interferase MazF
MTLLKTALIAPMTSKGFNFPTRILYTFQGKKGLILLDQIRAVDKSRLVKKLGMVSHATQVKICECLQELFAF